MQLDSVFNISRHRHGKKAFTSEGPLHVVDLDGLSTSYLAWRRPEALFIVPWTKTLESSPWTTNAYIELQSRPDAARPVIRKTHLYPVNSSQPQDWETEVGNKFVKGIDLLIALDYSVNADILLSLVPRLCVQNLDAQILPEDVHGLERIKGGDLVCPVHFAELLPLKKFSRVFLFGENHVVCLGYRGHDAPDLIWETESLLHVPLIDTTEGGDPLRAWAMCNA